MKFEFDGDSFALKFRHVRDVKSVKADDTHGLHLAGIMKNGRRKAVTSARLIAYGDAPERSEVVIAMGLAECSRKDQFVKSEGRRVALQSLFCDIVEQTEFDDLLDIKDTIGLMSAIHGALSARAESERLSREKSTKQVPEASPEVQ